MMSNGVRYGCCAVFSLVIHGIAFFSPQPELPITMAVTQPGEAMNVQFQLASKASAPPKSVETPVIKKHAPPENKAVKNNKVVKASKQTVKKPLVKPVTKSVTKAVKKPIKPLQKTQANPVKPPVIKPADVREKKLTKTPAEVLSAKALHEKKGPESAQQESQNARPKLLQTPLFKTKPSAITYPRMARRRHMEGEALIEVWLNQHGQQIRREVIQSTGFEVLDNSALKSIEKWQFERYQQNGRSIAHRVRIPVKFKLD